MWQQTYSQLTDAIKTGFGEVEWGQPDYILNQNLKYNAATFAAFKNHAESKEIQKLILSEDPEGRDVARNVSWKEFRDKALSISEKYNHRWLQTEYNHAVQSSRMARKWQDAVGDADLYPNLKYVTAGDERVRHSHASLNGAIYPIDDPFWDTYYPPNGWGCRCTVRPTDQPAKDAAGLPEMPEMFKTNPGKTAQIFPPSNPYQDKATAKEKKYVEKFVKENVTGYTKEDVDYLVNKRKGFNISLDEINANPKFKKGIFKDIPQAELAAIKEYSNSAYFGLNQELRNDMAGKYHKAFEKVLNTAIDNLPKDKTEAYFRGAALDKKVIKEYEKHFKDGTVKVEKAFTSTTTDKTISSKFNRYKEKNESRVLFRITGKNGVSTNEISNIKKENEVLFKSKTKMKVIDFKEIKNGKEISYEISLEETD